MTTQEEFDTIQVGDHISLIYRNDVSAFLTQYCNLHNTDRYVGRVIGVGYDSWGGPKTLFLSIDSNDAKDMAAFSVNYAKNSLIDGGAWVLDVSPYDYCFGVSGEQFESFEILNRNIKINDSEEERGGLAYL